MSSAVSYPLAFRAAQIVLLFIFTLACSPASLALNPAQEISHYAHEIWQTEDGLPQNTVRSILQTRDGYLWLATEEGLARYDGFRFTVFDKQNTPQIVNNSTGPLFEARDGSLWIAA